MKQRLMQQSSLGELTYKNSYVVCQTKVCDGFRALKPAHDFVRYSGQLFVVSVTRPSLGNCRRWGLGRRLT